MQAQNLDSLLRVINSEKVDNEIKGNTLLTLADYYLKINNDVLAEKTYQRSLEISKKIKNKQLRAKILKQMGVYYFSKNKPSKALIYFQKALLFYKYLRDTVKICTIYNNLAIIYRLKGNYILASEYIDKSLSLNNYLFPETLADSYTINGSIYLYQNDFKKAILLYQKSLDISQKYHLESNIADNYNNLGQVQYVLENYDKALDYYNKALVINTKLDDKQAIANNLNNLGNVYLNKKEFVKAKTFYTKALALNKFMNNEISLANNYMNLGIIYYYEGRYSQTIKYFKRTLEINKRLGNKKAMSTILYNLAELNINLADSISFTQRQRYYYLNEALTFIKEAIVISKELHLLDAEQANYEKLSTIYEKMGKPLKALQYYKLKTSIKDSIFNREKSKQLSELETKYHVKQKTRDIQNLLKQQHLQNNLLKVKQQQAKRQHIVIIIISVGFILLLIFLFIILRLLSQKKKVNALLAEQNKKIQHQKEAIEANNNDLRLRNEEISSQRDELQAKKIEIERIHHEIEQSIDYAMHIQSSILPSAKILKKYFKDYFVLFYPRDKVSGDFYWWEVIENKVVVTVSDCTGHGVPGAFMSILGISFLREIVVKEYITHPGVILRRLRKEINKTLKQDDIETLQKDGMDMALITIDYETNKMQYAGANNPIYIIRSNRIVKSIPEPYVFYNDTHVLIELKPDKMPIGIYQKMERFTTYDLQLEDGDQIYLFSDGLIDQFGGSKNKKFKSRQFKNYLLKIANKPMDIQKKLLEDIFVEWKGNNEQVDDITIVGITI